VNLLVPHLPLAELIGSHQVLIQMWPAAAADVMAMVHVLMVSTSLAQALTLQLVVLVTPSVGGLPAQLALALGSVVVTALAIGVDLGYVPDPHSRTGDVTGLEIIDLAIGGTSAVRVAG
jgi:hypothetical protein